LKTAEPWQNIDRKEAGQTQTAGVEDRQNPGRRPDKYLAENLQDFGRTHSEAYQVTEFMGETNRQNTEKRQAGTQTEPLTKTKLISVITQAEPKETLGST